MKKSLIDVLFLTSRTAVFSFEGIGLVSPTFAYPSFFCLLTLVHEKVIPITDSMREPRKFPAVLTGVMLFLTGTLNCLFDINWNLRRRFFAVLFGGAGVLAYLAFGSEIRIVVITNLDSESKFVQAVRPHPHPPFS